MYTIEWTRKTGETGVFVQEFSREYEAQQAVRALLSIDTAKGQNSLYKYEIIKN